MPPPTRRRKTGGHHRPVGGERRVGASAAGACRAYASGRGGGRGDGERARRGGNGGTRATLRGAHWQRGAGRRSGVARQCGEEGSVHALNELGRVLVEPDGAVESRGGLAEAALELVARAAVEHQWGHFGSASVRVCCWTSGWLLTSGVEEGTPTRVQSRGKGGREPKMEGRQTDFLFLRSAICLG